MGLKKGDIVLAQFPFTDLSQTKLRPALVLYGNVPLNEITLCFISSQNINDVSSQELAILISDEEFTQTGLRVSSKVRVTRIVTLQRQLILRHLGKLGNQQMIKLNKIMKEVFKI